MANKKGVGIDSDIFIIIPIGIISKFVVILQFLRLFTNLKIYYYEEKENFIRSNIINPFLYWFIFLQLKFHHLKIPSKQNHKYDYTFYLYYLHENELNI